MSGNPPGNPIDDHSEVVTQILQAALAEHRRSERRRSKEIRELITRVGIKAGIPPRRPSPRKPPAAALRKPIEQKPKPEHSERLWTISPAAALETGEYEIVHEISHAGAVVVYAARRTADGGAPPKLAIKAIQPPGIWTTNEGKQSINDFLAAVRLQKRIADAHPKGNWAPIHGEPVEVPRRGAYYVSNRFVRSADDLASPQREAIAEENLWQLVSGVVDGLEQLEKTAERPHGNLKAGNVLLMRRKGRYKAFLADPRPDEAVARKAGRAGDLRNLGDLIRRLVLRDSGGTDAATASLLGAPTAWSHLGAAAQKWRELCGALLEGGERYPTFGDLRDALKPLRPANRNRGARVTAIAASITLLIGGTAYAFWPKTYKPQDWKELCQEWAWYDSARNTVGTYAAKDAKLAKILAVKVRGPSEIAGVPGTFNDLELMADHPSATMSSQKGITETLKALEMIDRLHKMLADPNWEFWKSAGVHIDNINAAEPRMAQSLKDYLEIAQHWAREEKDDAPSGLNVLAKLESAGLFAQLEQVNERSNKVAIAATWKDGATDVGDPFVADVVHRIRSELDIAAPKMTHVETLKIYLDADDKVTKELSAALVEAPASRLAWKRIKDELDTSRPLAKSQTTTQFADAVNGWLKEATTDYVIVSTPEDPRKSGWDARINLVAIQKMLTQAAGQPGMNDTWRGQLNDLQKRFDQLQGENRDFIGATFIAREKDTKLKPDAERFASRASELLQKIIYVDSQVAIPKDWVQTARAQTALPGITSPAVNDFWLKRKNALLATDPTQQQLGAVYREVNFTLAETAQKLDKLLAPSAAVDNEESFAWSKPFRAFESAYHDRLLLDLTTAALRLPARGALPDSFLNGEVAQTKSAWDNWQKALAGWIQQGMNLENLLTPAGGLYAFDETPPGGKSSLQDQWRRWINEPRSNSAFADAAKDSGIASALDGLNDRYKELSAVIDAAPSPAAVNALLKGPAPAQKWAGWHAAGKLEPAEWLPLTQERDARDAMLALIAQVPAKDRQIDLDGKAREEGRRRWLLRVKPAAPPTPTPVANAADKWPEGLEIVRSALPLKDAFEIRDRDLNPAAVYNLRLAKLITEAQPLNSAKTATAEADANQKARALTQGFLRDMSSAGAIKDQSSVAGLIAKLEEAEKVANDPKTANRATTIPLLMNNRGWKKVPVPNESDEDVLAFENPAIAEANRPLQLQFARVDPSGQPSAFVLRGTVTVDQFSAVLPKTQLVAADLPKGEATAVFDVDENGPALHLSPRTAWAQPSALMAGQGLTALIEKQLGQPAPSGSLPVQLISPKVARLFAQSLGLRFPTIGEWKAALDSERAGPAHRWNLRGLAWKSQDKYYTEQLIKLQALDLNPRKMKRFGPRSDSGNIWNASLTGPTSDAQPYADGVLLFLPSEPDKQKKVQGTYGSRFYHVIGNVWQIVTDDPPKKDIFVVGGSALSPPEMGRELPQAIDPDVAYTDVGFRLAFEAPVQPPRSRLLAALREAQFLHD